MKFDLNFLASASLASSAGTMHWRSWLGPPIYQWPKLALSCEPLRKNQHSAK